jgi:tetrahydromethanopterin S-methyltransferase subunit F
MTEGIPVDVLEKRAADERRQLHNSVQELRESVQDRLDIKRNVRNHLGTVAGVLAIAGLALGYVVTGVFTSD